MENNNKGGMDANATTPKKGEISVINMTAHPVVVILENGEKITFPPSGRTIRLEEIRQLLGKIQEIPVYKVSWNKNALPEKKEGVFYIVSQLVKSSFPEREDLLVPYDLVRVSQPDGTTKIEGCRGFAV